MDYLEYSSSSDSSDSSDSDSSNEKTEEYNTIHQIPGKKKNHRASSFSVSDLAFISQNIVNEMMCNACIPVEYGVQAVSYITARHIPYPVCYYGILFFRGEEIPVPAV